MRIAGAAMLFLFFSLMGFFAGQKEKRRLAECEAFLEFFEYIKNQVNYFLTPTKVMYRSFSSEILEDCGFLPALRSHESDEVYQDVWRISLKSCEKNLQITSKQKSLIFGFGDCIGKSNGDIQTANFDYYISEMRAQVETEKQDGEKNTKLYRTLGITAGACAAILVM